MPIPESQLERWSHQGAVNTAKRTHESIREALSRYQRWPEGIKYEVYLQGSYKNDTNIRGDSDVDVVVQLNSSFYSNLSEDQKRRFGFMSATYDWQQFRSDVLAALREYYGWQKVGEGRKSLKVQTPYLPADVVVCLQYRKYPQYPKNADDYVEGMTFYVQDENRRVVNYPKLHYDNGVTKNFRTNGWYKPTVRLFKNARTYLVERKVIPPDLAPSYFLECFLYNVPDSEFGLSFQDTFCKVVNWWLDNRANFSRFVCQNGQDLLFGNSPEQWLEQRASTFVNELAKLWNNWR